MDSRGAHGDPLPGAASDGATDGAIFPPSGDTAVVFTSVQGADSLWEACPTDMMRATDLHNAIVRHCCAEHSGYETTSRGDCFQLAFQRPEDAVAFALQAQLKLYRADWPEGVLRHPVGKDEPVLKLRGFRVRFGIHCGPTSIHVHATTGRTVYSGATVNIAKAVEGMCHGGQILTTMETWKMVAGMRDSHGHPQVLDQGEHLMFESKTPNPGSPSGYTITRYSRRIMQLVPSNLAFDYFDARGQREILAEDGTISYEAKDASSLQGRLFPPLVSKRQLSTCFLNAPYAHGLVTMCFVYTVGLDKDPVNKAKNLPVLAKHVRKTLYFVKPPGYECSMDYKSGTWMLAFDSTANAVGFGLKLKSTLSGTGDPLAGTADRAEMFKVGIVSGPFTSMGPHKFTGMADYFGPIVNRATRVASDCEPGQLCVGMPLSDGATADPPDLGPTVNVGLRDIKRLKGITVDMAIFSCSDR